MAHAGDLGRPDAETFIIKGEWCFLVIWLLSYLIGKYSWVAQMSGTPSRAQYYMDPLILYVQINRFCPLFKMVYSL